MQRPLMYFCYRRTIDVFCYLGTGPKVTKRWLLWSQTLYARWHKVSGSKAMYDQLFAICFVICIARNLGNCPQFVLLFVLREIWNSKLIIPI